MTIGEIYAEHAPAIFRCLLVWSRNAAIAEDLTAETFYRAIISGQAVRSMTARGYLIAIAITCHGEDSDLSRAAKTGDPSMTLHPDVFTDLVILYHAGEASQESRELLEKEAQQNPALAAALAPTARRAAHRNGADDSGTGGAEKGSKALYTGPY